MDPFLVVSLVLIISGSSLLGAVCNYLYTESQAEGVWLPFEDYNSWVEWKDKPALGEGLGRRVIEQHMEDKLRIADLELESEASERHIVLLKERIDTLIADRETVHPNQFYWSNGAAAKTIGYTL